MRRLALALMLWSTPADATVDSWVVLRYPLADMQVDDAYCEAQTVVLDAHSSGPSSTAAIIAGTLARSIDVPNPLAQTVQTIDANAITADAKAPLKLVFIEVDSASGIAMALTIDITGLSGAHGTSVQGRTDAHKRAKLALIYVLKNFFSKHPKSTIAVTIVGLPDQTDIPGQKLLEKTLSPYTATSPIYRALVGSIVADKSCAKG